MHLATDLLTAAITHEDISAALKRLKQNKAADVDDIRAAFILDASEVLLHPLHPIVQTFNQVAMKVPLLHGALDRYTQMTQEITEGITIVVILAKRYAMVLEPTASAWTENKKCKANGQAGFRKAFCTTDQVFIMHTLMQQTRLSKRKSLGSRRPHLVPCWTLWNVLEQRGMKGKVMSLLKAGTQRMQRVFSPR